MYISTKEACQDLKKGKVVALPTETVYGLAASLSYCEAIDWIFTLKERPQTKPLVIQIANLSQIGLFTQELPKGLEKLAAHFWPGPLTLVIPINKELVSRQVRGGLSTAGFRIPNHPLALEVLRDVGPLAVTSANISGGPEAKTPEEVDATFKGRVPILNGGACSLGVASTVLEWKEETWIVLREGAIAKRELTSLKIDS